MVTEFKFPDVGEGITEGTLLKWLVSEGEKVKQDQALAEIETDKAVVELPAPITGTILRLHAKAGEKIRVGAVLVTIGEKGEATLAPSATSEDRIEESHLERKVSEAFIPKKTVEPDSIPIEARMDGMVFAMPHTRKLARMLGVDIRLVHGTGNGGKVTDADVKRYKERKETPSVSFGASKQGGRTGETAHGREERIPLAGIRKAVAEHVQQSFRRTVPVTIMDEADVSALVGLRETENKKLEPKGVHLTFLPFVIKACLVALEKHPYFNASMDDEKSEIVLKHYYHIGIAVDTEEGLMVPVIKNADTKSIVELAIEIQELAKEARERKINLGDLRGSSFSITNYGSVGGKFGTPIINYPDVAVLGMGKIKEQAVVQEGKIVVRKMFPLSLTFDHRIADGGQAGLFLEEIMRHLEDPGLLLVDNL